MKQSHPIQRLKAANTERSKKGSTIRAGDETPLSEAQTKSINMLFLMFETNYVFWQHGKSPEEIHLAKRLWGNRLKDIHPYVIESAAKWCIDEYHDKSGPNIGKFLLYCRKPTAHQDYVPALPGPMHEQIGNKHLDNLKALLRIRPKVAGE